MDAPTSEAGTPAVDLDGIIAELDTTGGELPEKAIREARAHRDETVPKLIEVIRRATAEARAGEPPEGNAHFFALFLLTEFQAKEALPAIIEAVSLPGKLPSDLFGDAITSTLARVWASLSGEPGLLDDLIRNRELDEFVRWEAAETYIHLVRDGRLDRGEAVERLRQHLREAIEHEDEKVAVALVEVLTSFSPKEAYDDIAEAYRRELIDPFMIGLEDVEQSISEGETRWRETLRHCSPTGIEDTIAELRRWAAFQEEEEEREEEEPVERITVPLAPLPDEPLLSLDELAPPPASATPRVGRNAPCPCGSGKKYKKCCGLHRG
jgi:hypothetical protein